MHLREELFTLLALWDPKNGMQIATVTSVSTRTINIYAGLIIFVTAIIEKMYTIIQPFLLFNAILVSSVKVRKGCILIFYNVISKQNAIKIRTFLSCHVLPGES
jgi:hypothetical protein